MNTPKIRFKGFADEWEQRKLGDLFEIIDTKHATAPTSNVKTQFRMIRTNCVRNGRLISENTDSVTEEIYEKWSERIHLREGDLVFTREAPMGESAVITNDGNKYFPGQRVVSMRSLGNVKACFINQLFYSNEFRKEIQIREAASTTVANFGIPQIKNYLALIPCLDEQIKIGDLFSCIDNLITLYQRKCDSLNAVKKYMLQKMFPKNGAKVPEIRFKGFTGDWEQRKLGDMVSFSKGTGYSKSDLQSEGTPIILYGRLYTNYETVISDVDTFVEEKPNSVFSKGREVIVPASGETAEDIAVASVVEKEGVLLGGDLNIITPPEDLDSAFLALSIANGKPHNDMAKMAQGKSVVHLHNSDLAKIDLPYPSYEEQCKISSHFANLDNLITLHQRKCDSLKELKKFMLQNMFP